MKISEFKEKLDDNCERNENTSEEDRYLIFLTDFLQNYQYSNIITEVERDEEIMRLEKQIAIPNMIKIQEGTLSLLALGTNKLYIKHALQSLIMNVSMSGVEGEVINSIIQNIYKN